MSLSSIRNQTKKRTLNFLREAREEEELGSCVLDPAEEEAVDAVDSLMEGLDGKWELSAGRLEVGIEQCKGGDVAMLHTQPRDEL